MGLGFVWFLLVMSGTWRLVEVHGLACGCCCGGFGSGWFAFGGLLGGGVLQSNLLALGVGPAI